MNRSLLIAIGACLVFVGFVMRGIARGNRRTQAYRKQHELDAGAPDAGEQPDAIDRHLEKWLPRYAAVSIVGGFLVIIAGFWLR